jgi:GDP-4-dehydro-6-deoxy-D-mannose reductase
MTIIVAGINGFVGQYVAEALESAGHEVIGIGREPAVTAKLTDLVSSYVVCDLANADAVMQLQLPKATAIINLAGFAKVGVGENDRAVYETVNVGVHKNLAEYIKAKAPDLRMISVSSGAVYDPHQAMPLMETSKTVDVETAGVYPASKLKMETALEPYQQQGLGIIIARPFNHSGPGQQNGFLIPDLAQKIAATNDGDVVTCGNLETKRDYTHVRDVARAYTLLATSPDVKEPLYNICSGRSVAGTEIFTLLKDALGKPGIDFKIDPALKRPNDPAELFGSYDLLKRDTGWQPELGVKDIIADFAAWLSTK